MQGLDTPATTPIRSSNTASQGSAAATLGNAAAATTPGNAGRTPLQQAQVLVAAGRGMLKGASTSSDLRAPQQQADKELLQDSVQVAKLTGALTSTTNYEPLSKAIAQHLREVQADLPSMISSISTREAHLRDEMALLQHQRTRLQYFIDLSQGMQEALDAGDLEVSNAQTLLKQVLGHPKDFPPRTLPIDTSKKAAKALSAW